MKVSIITINYNNVVGLQLTIDSVLMQTAANYEWIVIDGGSTDGSRQVIEKYARQGKFDYWCSEKDRGIYHAMNKGIAKASGDYYLFLNSGDTFFDQDVLQKFIASDPLADIVYGDSEMINADGSSYVKIMPDEVSLDFFFKNTIIHQATFIKSVVFAKFLYDETLKVASDRKLWFQCLLDDCSFVHLPFTVCKFDLTGVGTVGKYSGELEYILNELFPISVQKSIQELAEYKYVFPQIPNLIYFIKYRRLYKRMTEYLLRIFWLINRFS